MKKQLIFLMVLFMIFGFSKAFAQAPNLTATPITYAPTPIDATCVQSGPLNPVAGTEYTYTVNVTTPAGLKTFHWFVTTDINFISGGLLTTQIENGNGTGPHIAASGTSYNLPTDVTAPTDNSVLITWKSFTHNPSAPVFLVIYVKDETCDNDNIEVYVIKPVHSFTLDISNLATDGTPQPDNYEVCVSPVLSAIYNTTSERVEFDFGTNYLFFIVTAANFTHSWMPSFLVGGAGMVGSREVTAVDWAYLSDAEAGPWVVTTEGTTTWSSTTAVNAPSNGTVGATGQSIVVRVTILNNQQETIIDAPITLAVDGVMYDVTATNYTNTALGDIHWEAGGGAGQDCPWIDGFDNDIVTQVLTARPDINAVTPTPFAPTDKE